MAVTQEQKYIVNNNGTYMYLSGRNGDYVRIQNDKIKTIQQFRMSSFNSKDTYCVYLGHEGGSLKLCSENKKMMEQFVKEFPQNDSIKRSNEL